MIGREFCSGIEEILSLSSFEKKNGKLIQIEEDEVLGLMRDIGPKASPDDAVPGRVILFIKLFLDESSYFFFGAVLFHGH